LTKIFIPESVTEIGDNPFDSCENLTSIAVSEKNEVYDSRDNCNAIIEKESNTLICGCKNTIIPDSVTEIGSWAFRGCIGLTSILIPDSVTLILYGVFDGCKNLDSIAVSEGNKKYDSRENCNAIIKTSANILEVGCKNTVIPDSVTEIGGGAFSGSGIEHIVIPEAVSKIDWTAFYNCNNLTSIVVAEGNAIYDSRDNSNAIIYTETNEVIVGCKNTVIPSSVTALSLNGCTGLSSIIIPNTVTDFCFYDCTDLTSIVIPDSITEIKGETFRNCSNLTYIDIPNSVTKIGRRAFVGCSRLAQIVIPDSVTDMEERVFEDCSGLQSIDIRGKVKNLRGNVFRGCSSLETVTLCAGIKKLDDFHINKSVLKAINVPAKKGDYYCQRIPEEFHRFIVELPTEKKK